MTPSFFFCPSSFLSLSLFLYFIFSSPSPSLPISCTSFSLSLPLSIFPFLLSPFLFLFSLLLCHISFSLSSPTSSSLPSLLPSFSSFSHPYLPLLNPFFLTSLLLYPFSILSFLSPLQLLSHSLTSLFDSPPVSHLFSFFLIRFPPLFPFPSFLHPSLFLVLHWTHRDNLNGGKCKNAVVQRITI